MTRNVLVTGAGDGLGRVIAERFLALDDRVFACDISADSLEALPNAHVRALDVGDHNAVSAYVAEVLDIVPTIDLFVSNVGVVGPIAAVEDIDPEGWTATMNVNVGGTLAFIRGLLPAMKRQRRGAIVAISTISTKTLPVHRAPYIVSKAALEALILAVAREAAPFGIGCNAIRPGMMNNARMDRVIAAMAARRGQTPAEAEAEQLRFVGMKSRIGMDEVADMVVHLASPAGRHITGQMIAVDGGLEWEM